MKNLIIILVLSFTLTSCKYLHIFNSILRQNNIGETKPNKIISQLPPIKKESKWYGFLVLDKKLDMNVSFYFENDSTFHKYYNKERYQILDTLVWGSNIEPN